MQMTLEEFVERLPLVFDYGYTAREVEGKIRLYSRFDHEEHPVIMLCSIYYGLPYCQRWDCNPYQVAFYGLYMSSSSRERNSCTATDDSDCLRR